MITLKKPFARSWMACTALVLMTACATSTPAEPKKKELSHTELARKLVEIANGSIVEGDATGALQTLFRAEQEDSKLPELYHSEAIAFYLKHDAAEALVRARKAVDLKSDYSDANNTLGKLLMDAGKQEEAIAPLTRAANDPLYREAFKPLTNLGIIYYRRGAYDRADSFLSRAIVDAPTQACVAFYYRGHVRMHDSRFQDAVSDYENAGKKFCAGFGDAYLARGIAYERGKKFDLARKTYLEVESRFPNTKVAEQAMTHLRFLP